MHHKPSSLSAAIDSNADRWRSSHPDAERARPRYVSTSSCFAALRQLRQIRQLVPMATFQTLAVALVNQRLDYGNSTLVGIPTYLMRRLQSALNAAARLIFHLRRSDHVTEALVSLHWLRVPERIQLYVLHSDASWNLGPFTSTADAPGDYGHCVLPKPIGWLCLKLYFPPSVAELFRLPPLESGTLPEHIVSAPTLQSFRRHLKSFLLQQSFCLYHFSGPCSDFGHLGHSKNN